MGVGAGVRSPSCGVTFTVILAVLPLPSVAFAVSVALPSFLVVILQEVPVLLPRMLATEDLLDFQRSFFWVAFFGDRVVLRVAILPFGIESVFFEICTVFLYFG